MGFFSRLFGGAKDAAGDAAEKAKDMAGDAVDAAGSAASAEADTAGDAVDAVTGGDEEE